VTPEPATGTSPHRPPAFLGTRASRLFLERAPFLRSLRQMPVVMDADFNGVWVDEADLEVDLVSNASRLGSTAPAAADADNQDVEPITQPHPPLSDLEWCDLGFDLAAANALAECGAPRADLAANPPPTVRGVLASVHPWIGPLTAAVTAAVALRELDFAHSNDPSRLAATAPYAAATLLASGGLPQGGPPPPIEGLPQGGARTLTQAGPDSVGLACGDSSVPPEMGGTRRRLCLHLGVCPRVGPRLRSRVSPKGGPVL